MDVKMFHATLSTKFSCDMRDYATSFYLCSLAFNVLNRLHAPLLNENIPYIVALYFEM